MQLGNLYIEVQHADSKVQNMSFCYYYNSYLLPGAAKYFRCPTPLPGKSVKIIMKGTNKTLSVCEVKIFGSPIQSGKQKCILPVWSMISVLYTYRSEMYLRGKSVRSWCYDWCSKGRGMYYPVCGMVHIKTNLVANRKE